MRLTSCQREPRGLLWPLLLGLALVCVTSHSSLAKDEPAKSLPPSVARVLRWLPEDTETLIVARTATLSERKPDQKPQWQEMGSLALGEALIPENEKHLNALRGPNIECVVHGAKNFEGVSSFGSLRSEDCTIIVFEHDLGDAAKAWTKDLRKNAKTVRTLVGREVFVFPSATVMEPWEKITVWQGTYYVLLNPNTVLCASSDRYLESVLRRVIDAPRTRALPDNLPEWKHVDFDAPAWMLRNVPEGGRRTRTVGLTAAFTKNGFRVVYIPKTGSEVDRNQLREDWVPENLFKTPALRDRLKIERQTDGTVVVSFGEKPNDTSDIWLGFQIYRLQAFELFDAEE